MSSRFTFFVLEYKKSIIVFAKSVLSIVLMLLLLILGVTAVSYSILQSQVFEKVQVAVVIPEGEKEVKLAASYISAMKSVENICEFQYMDGKEAEESIKNGKVQAVMVFPDHFFEDVYVGENTPATIYFLDENAHNTKIFQGLLKAGVSLLQISEAGVYAALYVSQEYSPTIEGGELGDYMAGLYIKEILQKGQVFENKIISATGTLSYEQYYFSAALMIVLLMMGLNFGCLYEKRNKAVEQKLKLYGIGYWQIACNRITIMTGIMWITGLLFCFAAYAADMYWGSGSFGFSIKTVFGFALLCMFIACFFHTIYTICNAGTRGAVVILILDIIMIICSGMVVPTAYFPQVTAKIGRCLPVSLWSEYQNSLLYGTVSFAEIMWPAIIGLAGIGIGALFYEKRFDMV